MNYGMSEVLLSNRVPASQSDAEATRCIRAAEGTAASERACIFVTERAIFARLNRVLANLPIPERLHRCPERSRWLQDLGRYYADDSQAHLTRTHIQLAAFAREMGVLRDDEALVG